MTRKTLVSILTLILCPIALMSPEPAETREPSAHNAADYVQHGREKFSAGDYAGAIADFDKAFQVAPDRPEVSYYRANAKFQLGKWEHEEGNVEQAKRTYHSAIEDYARVITLDPENPPAYIFGGMVHLRLVDLKREAGNSQQARHHAHAVHKMGSQLTDVDPENVSGWRTRGVANYNLGMLAADRGDWKQAQRHYEDGIEAYTQAVAFDPENPAVYGARGELHSALGVLEMVRNNIKQAEFHYESALADHNQAVRVAPPEYATFFSSDLNMTRVKLGELEVTRGNIEQAQHQYQAAITGFDADIGIVPGESFVSIDPGDVVTALVYAERAVAKLRLGESHTLTGNVEQAEQHYREAIADCDQVLAAMNRVEVFYTRGRAKAALGDNTGAIADFSQAIQMKSDYALAYYARGLAKQQARGQHATGDDTALDLGDLADLIQQEVGQILEQDVTVEIERDGNRVRGQDTPAEADLQKAKALNPDVEKLYPFGI